MDVTDVRTKIEQDLSRVPEEHLPSLAEVIHHYRLGLEGSPPPTSRRSAGLNGSVPAEAVD